MYIVIVGCGRVGSELGRLLSSEGHNVVIVDKNPNAFERLGEGFNGVTLAGSGFDPETLKKAGIEQTDAFCAVSDLDNVNIMASQVAKKIFNVPKVIARIYDPKRAQIYKSLGVVDIISGTSLFAAMIRDKIIESHFSSYLTETGELGVLEVIVDDKIKGKTVAQLNIPDEFMVATIIKKTKIIIPEPQTVLEKGDRFMAVVRTAQLNKIKKELGI